jgi:uncharacterized protein (TIGR03437 family)
MSNMSSILIFLLSLWHDPIMRNPICAALWAAFSFSALTASGQLQPNTETTGTPSAMQSQAASPSCLAPPSGLVGWWPGDTGTADVAGTNNPSAMNAVTFVPGEVLNGFSFGTQGYMLIPSSPTLASQRFTWLAWVRPDGSIFNDNYGSIIVENNIDIDTAAFALFWRPKDSRFVMLTGADLGTGDTADTLTSKDAFPKGSFYLVAGTYDGTAFRLYVNGVLEASAARTTTIAYSSSGWTFGSSLPKYFSTSARTWQGVIDEVQAYGRTLSQNEILAIYSAGSAGVCKNPAISTGGVVSASAFGEFTAASPGSWIEIYGANLSQTTRGWALADFTGNVAPTSLDNVSVTIGGVSAYIDYVSPSQINALISSDTPTGAQPLIVKSPQGTSAAYNITINATEAGFLAPPSFNINGIQYAVAIFTDGTFALPTGAISGINSRPAKPGDIVTLYGVGFGPVTPNSPAGQLVQQLNTLTLPLQLSIAGAPAVLLYDGLAPNFIGLYQFNLTIPASPSGNAPLTFTLNGASGTQTLYIPVGQ